MGRAVATFESVPSLRSSSPSFSQAASGPSNGRNRPSDGALTSRRSRAFPFAWVPLAFASQKVKGPFLVVITYGFCEILRYVAINTPAWGGTSGLPGIKTPSLFGMKLSKIGPTNKDGYILILFAIVAFLAFFTWRLVKSRIGYAFSAIREDEIAAVHPALHARLLALVRAELAARRVPGF